MFSSGLLRPQSSNGILKNFRDFLSLEKTLEDLQQELYHCILAKPSTDQDNRITLVRKGLFPFSNKEIVDPDLLLPCVLASGVPVKDIKTIKVKLTRVEDWMWDVFSLLTSGGAVIEEIWCSPVSFSGVMTGAVYSPVIHEMIQQGKLLKLR